MNIIYLQFIIDNLNILAWIYLALCVSSIPILHIDDVRSNKNYPRCVKIGVLLAIISILYLVFVPTGDAFVQIFGGEHINSISPTNKGSESWIKSTKDLW